MQKSETWNHQNAYQPDSSCSQGAAQPTCEACGCPPDQPVAGTPPQEWYSPQAVWWLPWWQFAVEETIRPGRGYNKQEMFFRYKKKKNPAMKSCEGTL